jgi:calcium/proton exchanger cax
MIPRLHRQAVLTGRILTNLLLVLGTCLLMGGFQKHTQSYPAIISRLKSTVLIIASASLSLPTAHKLCADGKKSMTTLATITYLRFLLQGLLRVRLSHALWP